MVVLSGNGESPEQAAQLESESAHLQLQADMIATRKSLAEAQRNLDKIKTTIPYSPSAIIEAKSKVEKYQNGLKALQDLEIEDFPAEK